MKFDFIKIITGVFGQCPPCIDTDNVPNYLCDPCDTTVYSGGIAGWVAKKCKYTFDDITDSAEWYNAIEAKDVFGRINGSRISGGLTAPDFTTKKRGSCGQEEIVKQSRTVTLTDAENDADFSVDEMYNFLAIPAKHSGYEFGFVTCDGRFLGWFDNVAVRAYYQIAETDEDDSYWTAEFRFNEALGNFKQQQLSFLLDLPANVCWVQSITCAGFGGATTVPNGGTLQIVSTVNPTNATNPILNYSVVNGTGTATINALTGLLTGTGVGTVTVIVSATDQSGVTCSLEIEVV